MLITTPFYTTAESTRDFYCCGEEEPQVSVFAVVSLITSCIIIVWKASHYFRETMKKRTEIAAKRMLSVEEQYTLIQDQLLQIRELVAELHAGVRIEDATFFRKDPRYRFLTSVSTKPYDPVESDDSKGDTDAATDADGASTIQLQSM
jgi:hypothetical protein